MQKIDDYIKTIQSYKGAPLRFMEVCGTHTHNIFHFGIHKMLPPGISLISGPGCPVCVTPARYIDRAASFSLQKNSTLCTFGDMVRVPGKSTSIAEAKALGGNVRIIYSPMDVLNWAAQSPERLFYVTAVGFETTLPIYALLIQRIRENNVRNIRLFTSIKAIVPALYWICGNNPHIDGFIGPGHVSAIIGSDVYEPLCEKYGIPLAVGGFGFEHIVMAIYDLLQQSKKDTCHVHNLYPNAVTDEGNISALSLIRKYFIKTPAVWRGLGEIEGSGYSLSPEYDDLNVDTIDDRLDAGETSGCLCGQVITGRANPADCPFFARACTPASPMGPCMVSAEGTCGIWYGNRDDQS